MAFRGFSRERKLSNRFQRQFIVLDGQEKCSDYPYIQSYTVTHQQMCKAKFMGPRLIQERAFSGPIQVTSQLRRNQAYSSRLKVIENDGLYGWMVTVD